ncbi:MAG: putative Ig domain-containing protein, partial [Candidatus Omnitrophota bacterium]
MHARTGTKDSAAQPGATWLRHHIGGSDGLSRIFLCALMFLCFPALPKFSYAALQENISESSSQMSLASAIPYDPCGYTVPLPTIDSINPFVFQSELAVGGRRPSSYAENMTYLREEDGQKLSFSQCLSRFFVGISEAAVSTQSTAADPPQSTVAIPMGPYTVIVAIEPQAALSGVTYPSHNRWSVAISNLTTGDYTLRVRSRDSRGCLSAWRTASFTVDTASSQWLLSQQVPNDIVPSPYPGREGLLVSYDIPASDPLYSILGHRSFTYDDAVAAVALTLRGDDVHAEQILTALSALVDQDGRIGFSYNTANNFSHLLYRTGTIAWVGYAMALYQKKTGDTQFQVTAQKIADYLLSLQDLDPSSPGYGSLKGGPDLAAYPTEHNVDGYFFLREIGSLLDSTDYLNAASWIENSLLVHHWNPAGHFDQAVGDPAYALDASSWGAIFLAETGETEKAENALTFAETTFKNTQTITGTDQTVTGYGPYATDVVWSEGTLGVAAAYQRLGQTNTKNAILAEMMKLRGPAGGIFYAMPKTTVVTGDVFNEWESVASTGWLLISGGASEFWSPPALPRPEFSALGEQAGAEGSPLSFSVSATDPGGGALTYTAENLPEGAVFNGATKTFSWTPDYDQAGTYQVYFVASNGTLEAILPVTIIVNDTPIANSAPVIDPIPNQLAGPNMTLTFTVTAWDPNAAETVTLSAAGLPAWLAITSNTPGNPATMTLSGSPGSDTESYTLTFTALDDGNPPLSVSQDVLLTIDRTAPPPPNVNPVTSPTNVTPYVLSGTKQVNTSIWINGAEAVSLSGSPSWSYAYPLAEGENLLSITAKDAVLNESAAREVSILYYKVNAPLPDRIAVGGVGDQKNSAAALFQKEAYLVWEDSATGEVLFNRSLNGGLDWEGTPLALGTGTGPRIAVDQVGKIYAVWSEGAINSPGAIQVRRSDDGGSSFGPATQAGTGYVPDIAVSSEGNLVYVAFHHKNGSETMASCARSLNGGQTFETPVRASEVRSIDDGLYPLRGIHVATTLDGRYVFVGFSRLYTNQSKAILARSTDFGASFEQPNLKLNDEIHSNDRPGFALAGDTLYAVFKHNYYGENHIYVKKSGDFGVTWGG